MIKLINTTKGFITAGTLFAVMLSMPFASSIVMQQQTADLIYESIDEVPEKNVAMVLGAAAYPTRLSDILQDRMDAGIELHEADKVTKLILTGAPNEVEGMKEYALEKGISENDIIEDPEGLNTLASIKNAEDISEMIIVTQNYHLPRALFIARYLGIDAVGYASDKRSYEKIFEFKSREILASSKAMMELLF